LVDLKIINVQTNSLCNANCVFCPYVESWHKNNPGSMKESLYRKILDDLEEYPNFEVFCPYFQNDPLLDKRIFDLIEMFYDKYPDKKLELSVNPFNIHKTNRDKLFKVLNDRDYTLIISFNGRNEVSFEYTMKIPYYHCLDQVLKLVEEHPSPKIIIRGLGESINNEYILFDNRSYFGYWWDILEDQDLLKEVKFAVGKFDDRAGQLTREDRIANKINFNYKRIINSKNPLKCKNIDNRLCIRWNGDIAICPVDFKKEITLGNISEMSITEYFNSEPYNLLVKVSKGEVQAPENFICTRCSNPGAE